MNSEVSSKVQEILNSIALLNPDEKKTVLQAVNKMYSETLKKSAVTLLKEWKDRKNYRIVDYSFSRNRDQMWCVITVFDPNTMKEALQISSQAQAFPNVKNKSKLKEEISTLFVEKYYSQL